MSQQNFSHICNKFALITKMICTHNKNELMLTGHTFCMLQAILRELQILLGLMQPAVSLHRNGELRKDWLQAKESMMRKVGASGGWRACDQ